MKEYHKAWLEAHTNRDADWLKQRLADGFDVHHIDGDHSNNDPANLILIEHKDHMLAHRGSRINFRTDYLKKVCKPGPPKIYTARLEVRLEKELKAKMKKAAKDRGVNANQFVRDAIREHVNRTNDYREDLMDW